MKNNATFFSIITCTYNSEKYLSETIRSVEEQSYTNFEHIFIDAFSNDDTLKIIKAYQTRYPDRVSIVQLPPKGISSAMNAGVDNAKGDVVLHLHGDDFLASGNALRLVKDQFDATKAAIVIGNCKLLGATTEFTRPQGKWRSKIYKRLLFPIMFHINPIPHPSTFISRQVFLKYGGFDDKLKLVMDYDFWFRILKHNKVVQIDDVLSVYRFHDDTASTLQLATGLREIKKLHRTYRTAYPLDYTFYMLILRPLLMIKRVLKR